MYWLFKSDRPSFALKELITLSIVVSKGVKIPSKAYD
jgi:hypothetical protein